MTPSRKSASAMDDAHWLAVQDARVADLEAAARAVVEAWDRSPTNLIFDPIKRLREML